MAQIPDPGTAPSVTPNGVADTTQRVASGPDAFGSSVAQGLDQAAQGVGQAADNTARIVLNDAQLANQTAVNQRFNQLQQTANTLAFGDGTSTNQGFFATRGQQTMAGYQGTADQLQQTRDNLAQGLSPEAQVQFEDASRRFVTGQLSSYGQHLEQQRRVFSDQTAQATADTDMQSAVAWRDNPDKFGAALSDMRSTIISNETNKGSSPQVINQAVADRTSKLYANVVLAKSETDPVAAYQFYQDHQNLIGGLDQVQVERQLKPSLYQWSSRQEADDIVSGAAGNVAAKVMAEASGQGVDPGLALATARIESGMGSRLKTPLSSASGVFAMTDGTWATNGGTAANRGDQDAQIHLGVQNLASSQQVANQAVGGTAAPWQVYLTHQQGNAGGPALLRADANEPAVTALAPAYGGNVAQATRAIVSNGGSATMTAGQFRDLWAANYQRVAGTVAASAPGTAPGTPTSANPRDHAAEWLAQANGAMSPLGTEDPVYSDMVASRVRSKIGEIEYGQQQQDRASQNTLLSAALGLTPATPSALPPAPPVPGQPITAAVNVPPSGQPGPPPSTGPGLGAVAAAVAGTPPTARPTSIDQLLAISPDVKQAWANASPEVQRGILGMIERNSTEGPPVTPAAQTRYYGLLSESTNDPTAFLKENLADPDLLSVMPHGMLTSLMTRQASIDGKQATLQDHMSTMTHARAVVMPDLRAAGINPPTSTSTAAQTTTYASFDGRLDEALQQFQQQNNRRPNDAEIKTIGQTLLTPGFQQGTGHLWGLMGPTSQKLFQAQTGGTVSSFMPQVPANDRAQIISAYSSLHGGARPSEGEIAQFYMTARSRLPVVPNRPQMGGGVARGSSSSLPMAQTDTGSDEEFGG